MCEALGDVEYDVILTGVQAADDLDGQLGVLMAGQLGIPHVSAVSDISVDGSTITLHKEYAGGVMAKFQASGKCVLGIQSARQTPRYAPVRPRPADHEGIRARRVWYLRVERGLRRGAAHVSP